jgi:hypothetical protein
MLMFSEDEAMFVIENVLVSKLCGGLYATTQN